MSTQTDQPSVETILALKIASLMLHRDDVVRAARSTLAGARKATGAQALVLQSDLDALERRCDEADKVTWPVLPTP